MARIVGEYTILAPYISKFSIRSQREPEYRKIKQNGLIGYIDSEDNILIPLEWTAIKSIEDKNFIYTDRNNLRFPDCKDDYADNLFSRHCAMAQKNGKWFLINDKGIVLFGEGSAKWERGYDKFKPIKEGLIPVCINDKWGYIDILGNLTIQPQYLFGAPFCDNRAIVQFKDRYGYINQKDQLVIPAIYDSATNFYNGLAIVGIADRDEWNENQIIYADNGCIMNWEQMLIDIKGNKVCEFTRIKFCNIGDMYFVSNGSKWGLLDKEGNLILEPTYNVIDDFHEGIARVGNIVSTTHVTGDYYEKEYRYGYIDISGNLVVPLQYSEAENFYKGRACVKNKEWRCEYIIDKNGGILQSKVIEEPIERDETYDNFWAMWNDDVDVDQQNPDIW